MHGKLSYIYISIKENMGSFLTFIYLFIILSIFNKHKKLYYLRKSFCVSERGERTINKDNIH